MGENDLIVTIHRVLHVLGVLHFHRAVLVFELSATRRVEVHGAERRRGYVDVVDMIKHNRLVRVGQCEVLLGFLRHQSLSAMADHLLDQASSGQLNEQGHGHAAEEKAFPHDETLSLGLVMESMQVSNLVFLFQDLELKKVQAEWKSEDD